MVAFLMEELEPEEMFKVFRILPKDLAADVFSYLEVDNQQSIIVSLSDKEAHTAHIKQFEEVQINLTAGKICDKYCTDKSAVNCKTAVPYLRNFREMMAVIIPLEKHII